MNRQSIFSLSVAALALALLPTNVVAKKPGTTPPPSNVVIPEGYSMTAVATGLNFPTAMTFFGDTIWVTEMGTATSPAAVKEIDSGGNIRTMLTAADLPDGTLVSPLTGIVFARGWIWLIHRQTNSENAPGVPVGVISRFRPHDPVGTFATVIAGFPSFGDHPNSQIVFGADGRAYINGAALADSFSAARPRRGDARGADHRTVHALWWRYGSCRDSCEGPHARQSDSRDHRRRRHGVFF